MNAADSCEISERYTAIIAGLTAEDVDALWTAVLFGWAPVDDGLRAPNAQLGDLRTSVALSTAAQKKKHRDTYRESVA